MWSLWAVFAILALTRMNLFCLLMWAGAHKRDETRPPSLNQHEPSVSPPSLRRGSSMQLQPSEEEKQRRRDAGSPTDREIWQRKDTWTDRTDSRSCCSQTDRVKGRPSTENPHVRLPSERNRAAPYSRSSSSYNSLYLLLLNLKEKTGFRNKKMPIYCTDTWEKKKEGQNIVDVWQEDRKKK